MAGCRLSNETANYGRIVLASDRAIYKQYALSVSPLMLWKMAQIGLMNVLTVEGKEHGISLMRFRR